MQLPSDDSRLSETPGRHKPFSSPVVVVCGAGAAGMAAAISAARCGANVWLIERRQAIGGTVAHSLIHTLGGLFDTQGELVNRGLPAELVDRLCAADAEVKLRRMGRTQVLSVHPELYQQVTRQMLLAQPGLNLLTGSGVRALDHRHGWVRQAEVTTPDGSVSLEVGGIVDATGGAHVVRSLDPQLVEEDERRAAGGLVVRLEGAAAGALDFPHGIALVRSLREAAADGRLPATCQHAWLDQGARPGEIYVKLFVPPSTRTAGGEGDQLPRDLEEQRRQVVEFVQRLPGLDDAVCTKVGVIGVRDGGRVRGKYQLTGEDVCRGAHFEDKAATGCWPIEYWDPEQGLSLEYLRGDARYDIPLSCLAVDTFHNVWVAGKCLSADRRAHASARVVGTCWAMGQAAGRAAASLITNHRIGESVE